MMALPLQVAGDLTSNGLSYLDETFMAQNSVKKIVSRALSTKSYISTGSSQAEREQQQQDLPPELRNIRQIGEGQCGTVLAMTGTGFVLKLAKNNKRDALYNDVVSHLTVTEAFSRLPIEHRPDISVPRYGEYIHPSDELFWNLKIGNLPRGFTKTYALMTERIFPIPAPVREALFDIYAPVQYRSPAEQARQLTDAKNKDCLVRVYLGRRQKRHSASPNFKLRNFEMHVNEMEELSLDTTAFAQSMAQTLSILHWGAQLDANDVEFVLGSAPLVKVPPSAADYKKRGPEDAKYIGQNFNLHARAVGLWLLDFNECQAYPENGEGLAQLVKGFWFNDPYYPRPFSDSAKDEQLWQVFRTAYLKTTEELYKNQLTRAEGFIKEVEEEGKRRAKSGSLFG
ncbi:hypothetical protein DOTSEDRAFT_75038 [Dothistroma septosporum NZE10]|uniref:DUF3669 domain-containing protein n=1 Tax=Dothistroma septosporum (strain NZE10 / CBS 128990) TaxID=675120 RepID=M2YJP5_DOTSN|nr:hypothetical protein DOTSEDRAFT_75038 [Dothistroma septosporum NZE10]